MTEFYWFPVVGFEKTCQVEQCHDNATMMIAGPDPNIRTVVGPEQWTAMLLCDRHSQELQDHVAKLKAMDEQVETQEPDSGLDDSQEREG